MVLFAIMTLNFTLPSGHSLSKYKLCRGASAGNSNISLFQSNEKGESP